MKLYVASSWRNQVQPKVVQALRAESHFVYDFRHPDSDNEGFHWSEIDPNWKSWDSQQYIKALEHPLAEKGFIYDFTAMKWADAGILVLPSGRSAHIEAGYLIGAGKPLIILLDGSIEPELMYKMAARVCANFEDVITILNEIEAS